MEQTPGLFQTAERPDDGWRKARRIPFGDFKYLGFPGVGYGDQCKICAANRGISDRGARSIFETANPDGNISLGVTKSFRGLVFTNTFAVRNSGIYGPGLERLAWILIPVGDPDTLVMVPFPVALGMVMMMPVPIMIVIFIGHGGTGHYPERNA